MTQPNFNIIYQSMQEIAQAANNLGQEFALMPNAPAFEGVGILQQILAEIGNIQTTISNIQTTISNIQTTVSNIQTTVNHMRNDINHMRNDITNMQGGINTLQSK